MARFKLLSRFVRLKAVMPLPRFSLLFRKRVCFRNLLPLVRHRQASVISGEQVTSFCVTVECFRGHCSGLRARPASEIGPWNGCGWNICAREHRINRTFLIFPDGGVQWCAKSVAHISLDRFTAGRLIGEQRGSEARAWHPVPSGALLLLPVQIGGPQRHHRGSAEMPASVWPYCW